ncbi:MAG: zf-HC2 domain-containing protein [Clostridiaceae bacterium]|nr:zf-HC2 domain-containing protein [Clostridiaceae bacterium]
MNLPCDTVQDLLPLYCDGAASEVSAKAVKAHLEACPDCFRAYRRCQATLRQDRTPYPAENADEIDYRDRYMQLSEKIAKKRLFVSLTVAAYVCASAGFLLAKYLWKPREE